MSVSASGAITALPSVRAAVTADEAMDEHPRVPG